MKTSKMFRRPRHRYVTPYCVRHSVPTWPAVIAVTVSFEVGRVVIEYHEE